MSRAAVLRSFVVGVLGIALTQLFLTPIVAAGGGTIRGSVVDRVSGEPLVYAHVKCAGTQRAAMTVDGGTFEITKVPPGVYQVVATMMGFGRATIENVVVHDGEVTTVSFALEETIVAVMPGIDVFGDAPAIDTGAPNVPRNIKQEDLEHLMFEDVIEVTEVLPSVVRMDNEYFVQGGRPDENKVLVDGVQVNNVFTGQALGIGRLGAAGLKMQAGGMDAEYGDAQSAIIEIDTREGDSTFAGEFRYMTDDFGRADKTYTNYDNVSFGVGGPTFVKNLRYYVSAEASFSDGENPSLERHDEHRITEWLKMRDRMSHTFNLQSKLSYHKRLYKVTGEVIAQRSRFEEYHHNWNVEGYAQRIYYFQRLIPSGTGFDRYTFGGISVQYEGPWLERVRDPSTSPNPRPVVIEQVTRDPVTGEQGTVELTNFRAVDVDGHTILWDEAMAGASEKYKPWVLFEGFQFPHSKFSHFQEDSSYVFFNSAERTPEVESQNLQVKLALNHNVSDELLYELRVSRLEFNQLRSVGGKEPYEYDTAGLPVTLPNGTYLEGGVSQATWYTDANHPYFVTAYDFPAYSKQKAVQYLLRGDLTSLHARNHSIKGGFQGIYNDIDNDERLYPGQRRIDGETGTVQQGLNANLFHNFNVEGAFYIKDKWEYEGLVLNAGMRFEFITTGNASEILINNSKIARHVDEIKHNWSPRLGIAFPISDRNKFFFNYGRYTQWPSRPYLFASQDAIATAATLGNPNLDPELTVSYQAGVSHQFTNNVVANFVVFNKDIYGLISSNLVTDDSTGIQSLRYINRTYASARGLEVSLEKRMSRHVGFRTYYTYSFADGVASDADFGRSAAGLTHLPTDELPLDWDQRHMFNVVLTLQDSNNWGATLTYQYGSGFPWTPENRYARLQDPKLENSRRHPATHRLNVQGRKRFNVYGRDLTFFVEGHNLLDKDILRRNGERPFVSPPMAVGGMDNGAYLTETGEYGGAYLVDIDDDGRDDFVPVHDPTVFAEHRTWRLGLGFQF